MPRRAHGKLGCTVRQSRAASWSAARAPTKFAAFSSFSASPTRKRDTRTGPTRNLALLTFFKLTIASRKPREAGKVQIVRFGIEDQKKKMQPILIAMRHPQWAFYNAGEFVAERLQG